MCRQRTHGNHDKPCFVFFPHLPMLTHMAHSLVCVCVKNINVLTISGASTPPPPPPPCILYIFKQKNNTSPLKCSSLSGLFPREVPGNVNGSFFQGREKKTTFPSIPTNMWCFYCQFTVYLGLHTSPKSYQQHITQSWPPQIRVYLNIVLITNLKTGCVRNFKLFHEWNVLFLFCFLYYLKNQKILGVQWSLSLFSLDE